MTKLKFNSLTTILTLMAALLSTIAWSQFSTHSNLKSVPDKPWALDVNEVPWLPFSEDWSTGLLETNLWESDENWQIAGQIGNPAPSVEFDLNPWGPNYSKAITSRWLSGRDLTDGNIYLSYDSKYVINSSTGQIFFKVQICYDSIWHTVSIDFNPGNIDWTERKLNITEYTKGNIFKIRFLAEGLSSLSISNWFIDNISVYRACEPPKNLTGGVNFPSVNELILSWESPDVSTSEWMHWDSGENNTAIGLLDGGTFFCAIRFNPYQLINYNETLLNAIRLFPYTAGGTIVLKVWQGENASQLIYSQPVSTYIPGQWNEFLIDDPILIDNSTDLWIGYSITHPADIDIAGCDSGPAHAFYGDMISLDGIVWESMTLAYALNYNWNLQGLVITPLDKNKQPNQRNATRLLEKVIKKDKSSVNRQLLRYDIYDCYYSNNYIYIGSTTENFYIFEPENHIYGSCYVVSAVYTDCEAFSDEYALYYPKANKRVESLDVYPVPSENEITVSLPENLTSLEVFNFSNLPVLKLLNPEAGETLVNVSTLKNGIYFIRGISAEGLLYKGKFIVSH